MGNLAKIPQVFNSFREKINALLSRLFKGKPKPPEYIGAEIKRVPGLNCPQCEFRISISIPMLLSGDPIICPACGLKLTVDREKSKGCLAQLRKVDDAIQKAEKAKGGLS